MPSPVTVSEEQLQSQFTYIDAVSALIRDKQLRAYTHTFGCQQNEADTERIRGMLHEMGYRMTDRPEDADFILYNTCAVREHAEDRAFGNIGALSHLKKQRPDVVIALCGCMAQQEKNVEKIKKSYPQVSLLFGTHALWRFHHCCIACLLKRSVSLTSVVRMISPRDYRYYAHRTKGLAVHHVWLQQLLHLLYRTLCAWARAFPPS